uniref:Uncharacterized protein n=1 Tax=uncultured Prevotella sp. TaxID=159272 RepID=A0A6G8F1M6_9BACT|nr:hypothetical protein Prevot485_2780 [uncultured Prevotella sp.]
MVSKFAGFNPDFRLSVSGAASWHATKENAATKAHPAIDLRLIIVFIVFWLVLITLLYSHK